MAIYFIDGNFVPAEHAVIPVDDLAILRGIGVFDLLRTYDGRPYFLDAHIDRLESSAQKIGLNLPWSHAEIVSVVEQTLAKNDKVRTIGGIIGTVVDIKDDEITLKVDESNNTKIKVLPSAIGRNVTKE